MIRRVLVVFAFVFVVACSSDDLTTPDRVSSSTEAPATSSASASTVADEAEVDGSDSSLPPDGESTLELVLMWHQHQPRYPVIDGVISRPWVRVHAAKDYVDMATRLQRHPEVHATVNVTPSLLLQLEELASGTIDKYEEHTRIDADELDGQERDFIMARFFDVNPKVIDRFPRFRELADKRAALGDSAAVAFTTAELRDLQVLFNLAWTDPEYLAEEPLLELVERGRDYGEEHKREVLDVHRRLVQEAIDVHADLAAGDQVEITTTPLAHPILPLILDTNVAHVGDPTAILPEDRFREFPDAEQHVTRGLDTAERLLGVRPDGMWPGEGAVSDEALRIFARHDIDWIATGEDVLARSLGMDTITRSADDVVDQAADLYRPYVLETPDGDVTVFFRDHRISDLLAFEYSQRPATEAVDDLIERLRRGRDRAIADGNATPVISVILDGENAWEHYPNDGIDFLEELYNRLSTTPWIETVTPGGYAAEHHDSLVRLETIHPGSWFSPDFSTWIGETEEARAWDLLRRTRVALRGAERRQDVDAAQLAAATDAMLFAEGSDWFWWYGADQDSGDDGFFDAAYRELLGRVYDLIGESRPIRLGVPIVPAEPTAPLAASTELTQLEIDGTVDSDVTLGDFGEVAGGVRYAWADDVLQIVLDSDSTVDIYIGAARPQTPRGTTLDGRVLGYDAAALVRWDGVAACVASPLPAVGRDGVVPDCQPIPAASGEVVELAIPLDALGAVSAGDVIRLRFDTGRLEPDTAIGLRAPDVGGFDIRRTIPDVAGDDHGPGTFGAPTDAVFVLGAFDLTGVVLGETESEIVIQFAIAAPVTNPWGSASGLALQTFDVYLDVDDDASTGTSELIAGRNAVLADGAWDVAVTIEGWQPAVIVPSADGTLVESTPPLSIAVLPDDGRVTVRIPKSALPVPIDLAQSAVGVAVLSQEGFPSPGVRRVRDVAEISGQWVLGGAPPGGGHSRIIDWLSPEAGVQEAALGLHGPDGAQPPELPLVPPSG